MYNTAENPVNGVRDHHRNIDLAFLTWNKSDPLFVKVSRLELDENASSREKRSTRQMLHAGRGKLQRQQVAKTSETAR